MSASFTPAPPRPRPSDSNGSSSSTQPHATKYNPRPPPSLAASSSSASHKTSTTTAAGSPTAAAGSGGGVIVAAAPSASSSSSTVDKGINASPLHDVELYEALVKQLPDCPVIDSVLFTHRGVLDDAETPHEMLTTIDDKLQKWRTEQRAVLDQQYADRQRDAEFEATLANSKNRSEDEKRDAKLNDLSMRLEALEKAVQKDVDRVVSRTMKKSDKDGAAEKGGKDGASEESGLPSVFGSEVNAPDGGPPLASPFRKEWELLQIKKAEREADAEKECERVRSTEASKQEARAAIEHASENAKLGINEQLTRCALYSEQESFRLSMRREMAASRERLAALADAIECVQSFVVDSEERERAKISREFLSEVAPSSC